MALQQTVDSTALTTLAKVNMSIFIIRNYHFIFVEVMSIDRLIKHISTN